MSGNTEIRDRETAHMVPTYRQLPVAIVSGEGCWVTDADGERWLDLYGGHAVALTGHCHPRVVEAIREQAGKLLFYSNLVSNDTRAHALELLAWTAPEDMSRVFLCNSGAEANEAAIKIARRTTGRRRIVSMLGGFHGRTAGALSATALSHYRADYAPLVPDHEFVPFGDLDAVLGKLDEDTAGVLLEPIQSMGGLRTASADYFRALRRRCDEVGALLLFDEVQTGPGRTGTWWYGQGIDVVPDVISTAKGLASGVPAGAVLVRDAVSERIGYGDQGTTFGGGMLAAAAIAATIEVIRDEGLLRNALDREAQVRSALADVPGVVDVRGRGLLLGVVLEDEAPAVVAALREHRILAGSTPGDAHVLRLMPPLVLSEAETGLFTDALAAVLRDGAR